MSRVSRVIYQISPVTHALLAPTFSSLSKQKGAGSAPRAVVAAFGAGRTIPATGGRSSITQYHHYISLSRLCPRIQQQSTSLKAAHKQEHAPLVYKAAAAFQRVRLLVSFNPPCLGRSMRHRSVQTTYRLVAACDKIRWRRRLHEYDFRFGLQDCRHSSHSRLCWQQGVSNKGCSEFVRTGGGGNHF